MLQNNKESREIDLSEIGTKYIFYALKQGVGATLRIDSIYNKDDYLILIQECFSPYDDCSKSTYYNAIIFKSNIKIHYTEPIKNDWRLAAIEALDYIQNY